MISSSKRLLQLVIPPLVLFLLVLLAWHGAVKLLELPAYRVPAPASVVRAAIDHAPALAAATGRTAAAALCGFGLSLLGGLCLGILFSQSATIARSVYPYAIFLQTVPIVAIAPIIIRWFGYGFNSVVIVAFMIGLFPIITSATQGLTAIDPPLLELFKMHNASRWQTLVKLRLPNSVPYLVTGAKTSAGLSVVGAIVGEFFAGSGSQSRGLGYLIPMTVGQLKMDYLFAAVFCSALLGVVVFSTVSLIGATLLARWQTRKE